MTQSRTITAARMFFLFLFLLGLAPPPGEADDNAPPDQSSDIQERGLGGLRRPEVAPFSKKLEVAPNPPTPQPDLIGRKISSSGCAPGRVGLALIEVKNQGTAASGAFFTLVNSYNKQVRVRTGPLPAGGAFTHQVQIGCSPQGPCTVNGIVDVDREVAESNEGNNVIAFTCP